MGSTTAPLPRPNGGLQIKKISIDMKVFTTLSAVLAMASAESDAFFPHGGIRPMAQQQMRQATIQLRPVQSGTTTYITAGPTAAAAHPVPQAVVAASDPMVVAAANAAAAAAAAGTPVSPRFTYFEDNQEMQQPIMPMREGEMFEYDVNYVESKKKPENEKGEGGSVINMKEGDVYRFQKGDYDVKVNIKGVEASSYRKPEDKERDVEVKINGHSNSPKQDKKNQHDLEGRRRVVDAFNNEQDGYRVSTERNRQEDEDRSEQTHDVQVKIKSSSGSRTGQSTEHSTQKNDYRARQDFEADHHEGRKRLMSYHRMHQDQENRMRHHPMTDQRMSNMDMSAGQRNDIAAYSGHAMDINDRHMTERQMTDRQMTERQMSVERHMSDRQMADRPLSERHLSRHQMGAEHMREPHERRVYDERLRMMSDRRMHDRRLTDRRHLLPAYRQRYQHELNNEFNNIHRRPISNTERARLFKREAGFGYSVMASHPMQATSYMLPGSLYYSQERIGPARMTTYYMPAYMPEL